MRRGRRIIALLLAVLLLATSDTSLYQALAMEKEEADTQESVNKTPGADNSGMQNEQTDTGQTETGKEESGIPKENRQEPAVQPSESDMKQDAQNGGTATGQAPAAENTAAPAAEEPKVQRFEMNAKVNDKAEDSVASGDTFEYKIGYNIPAIESGGKFNAITIHMELPDNISVVPNPDVSWKLAVSGQDVATARVAKQTDGKTILSITLRQGLVAGNGNDVSIMFQADNFKMKNGTIIRMNPTITGTATGIEVQGSIENELERPAVTILADDGWNVSKSVVGSPQISNDKEDYIVTYKIDVSSIKENFNSKGRMDVTSYELIDILPFAARDDNPYVGYPQGGQPYEVTKVMMGTKELVKDSDYTLASNNGAVTQLRINTYQKATKEDEAAYQYVTEGSMMPTSYEVTVKYHRNPYIIDSNKPLTQWSLTNQARLNYALLGENAPQKQDAATVTLGEREAGGAPQKIVIDKYLKMGNDSSKLDEALQNKYGTGKIAFKLTDEDGNAATDINGEALKDKNGNVLTDATSYIDANGRAEFLTLRYGTYYLQEILPADSGLDSHNGRIKVKVENGSVTLLEDGGYEASTDGSILNVTNQTDKYGIVQFFKYGKNSSGVIETLADVTFTLTPAGASTPAATAVSEKDGRVRFDGIVQGTYDIRETKNNNSEYPLSNEDADRVLGTVTVTGGQIATPVFTGGNYGTLGRTDGYLNTSPKGHFKIRKTDSISGDTVTGTATFYVYGPFADAPDIIQFTEVPAEWEDKLVKNSNGSTYKLETKGGTATSIALDAGYYVLSEQIAPEQYAIIGNGMTVVSVASNTDGTETAVPNAKKQGIKFVKEGTVDGHTVTDASQLEGAVFEIWDAREAGICLFGEAGTLGDALTVKLDGTGKPTTETVELAPGTYYYIETKAPAGFQTPNQNNRIEFTVEAGKDVELTVINTADFGQIKIIKTDSYTGTVLKGAQFKIYTDAECTIEAKNTSGQNIGILTTDESGAAYSPILEADKNYYVKEVKAPDGYAVKTESKAITVAKNQEAEVSFADDPFVTLKINKVDSVTGTTITSDTASFKLKDANGNWVGDSAVSTVNGVAEFKNLIPGGSYSIYEFKAPNGYVPADAANGTLVQVVILPEMNSTNYPNGAYEYLAEAANTPLGTYKIYKTSDFDGVDGNTVPLAGAQFQLYKAGQEPDAGKDCVDGNKVGDITTTDTDGNAQWSGLVPGKYWLKETKADGHTLMAENPKLAEVKAGQNSVGNAQLDTIENTASQGKVEIAKVDSSTKSGLAGVTFNIYKEVNGLLDYTGKDVIAAITTDNSGIAVSGWLDEGRYVLVEQALPNLLSEYHRDTTPHPFTVTKGQTNRDYIGNQAITNVKMGKLFIDKTARFTTADSQITVYPLSGAQLRIFKSTGNKEADIQDVTKTVVSLFTMPSASWESGFLPAGNYWVEEVTAPEGYKLNGTDSVTTDDIKIRIQNTYEVTVTSGQKTKIDGNTAKITNDTKQGKLRIKKTGPGGNLLPKAQFVIYKEVTQEEYNKTAADDRETVTGGAGTIYLIKAKVSESSDGGGSMMETDENGTAATIALKAGDTYWFKETKAPDGYYMEQEWYGPHTVIEGQETVITVTNYPETPIPGTKIDSARKGVGGAYIAVFSIDKSSSASAVTQYLKNNDYETNVELRKALKTVLNQKVKNPDYQFTGIYDQKGFNGMKQIVVSDKSGNFHFTDLPPGTYYALEVLPPDNYAYNFVLHQFEVKVDADGNITTYTTLNIVDDLMGRLQVSKVMKIGGTEYPVEGVKYHVYKAKQDGNGDYVKDGEMAASGYTGPKGLYTSIYLPAGHYIVEEADASDYTEAAHPVPGVIVVGSADTNMSPSSGSYQLDVEIGKDNLATETVDGKESLKADHKFTNTPTVGMFTLQKKVINNEFINKNDVKVKFKLEKKNAKANLYEKIKEIELTVKKNALSSDIYLSDYLEEGEYRLSEISMPGYTLDTSVIDFVIQPGKVTGMDADGNIIYGTATDSPIVFTNHHKGYLNIEKTGRYIAENGNMAAKPLSGVQFQIYKKLTESAKDDCVKDNAVGGIKSTNNNGKINNWELDAGDYWLVEASVGQNNQPEYIMPDISTARNITIGAGKTLSLTGNDKIVNNSTYGRFKVKKVDANDTATGLSGAQFKLYTKNADGTYKKYSDSAIQTGNGGAAVTGLLPAGEYYLLETKTPDGYTGDTKTYYGPYTVTSGKLEDYTAQADKQIQNQKLFSIQLEKVDAADGKPLAGVVFGLYATEDDAKNQTNALQESTTKMQGTGSNAKATAVFDKLILTEKDGTVVSEKTFYIKEKSVPSNVGEQYLLNDTIYPVTVSYKNADGTAANAIVTLGSAVKNDRQGRVSITKTGQWTANGASTTQYLANAVFALYKVDANGMFPSVDAMAADTLVTGTDGKATSSPLESGWYALKELSAPAGYGKTEAVYWFQAENNKTVTDYYDKDGSLYAGNAIENGADSGRFFLQKFDGSSSEVKENLTALTGAVFNLYVEKDGVYTLYNKKEQDSTFEVTQAGYTSWYLPYGRYMIKENMQLSDPHYSYTADGKEYTISCAPDEREIEFEISQENAGLTQSLGAYNSPRGSIEFTKYGDTDNSGSINEADELLNGATFRLYTDKEYKNEAVTDSLRTVSNGVCTWENLAPGTYYIKETDDGKDKVEEAGYTVNVNTVEVVVPAEQTVKAIQSNPELMTVKAHMLDASGAGRLRVKKTDEAGNPLVGAEFKIYRKDDTDTGWIDTGVTVISTDSQDGTLSELLPAASEGTVYKVVEIKAPKGYTLDGRYHSLEEEVTVTPTHVPDVNTNAVSFTNKESEQISGFKTDIHKSIKDEDEDYRNGQENPIHAEKSLMETDYDYTVDFKVDGYVDGTNETEASKFTVTDNDIRLQYLTPVDAGNEYKEMGLTTEKGSSIVLDYQINQVTVGKSWNDSPLNDTITDKKVGAEIYVQTTLAQKKNKQWPDTPYKVIEDLSQEQIIKFEVDAHVIGVKVEYTNVLAGFNSDGLVLNTTFLNRTDFASSKLNELRQVTNKAEVSWTENRKDESGNPTANQQNGSKESEIVYAQIPSYIEKLPEVKIGNAIEAKQAGGYYSGDNIKYKVTVTNNVVENQDEPFIAPVVSIRMPADTTLVTNSSDVKSGFTVYYTNRQTGENIPVPSDMFTVMATTEGADGEALHPYTSIDVNGNYVEDKDRTTTQYTFMFSGNFALQAGEQLFIDFTGSISYEPKTGVNKLICPAYLSSSYKIPTSVENEKGLSYKPAPDASIETEEPSIDKEVGDDLSYLNQPVEVPVNSATSVQLVKSIGYDGQNWIPSGTATVNAGDQVYYKLTLYNNSSDIVNEIRLADILPFNGDSMTLTGDGRGTTIPASDANHDEMTLESVTPHNVSNKNGTVAEATVYYYKESDDYANSWKERDLNSEKAGSLKMLFNTGDDGWAVWTTSKPSERQISAVGVNATFADGLQPGDSYDVILKMNTPEYTVEQLSEYDKTIMANTAASAVVKAGDADAEIPPKNRTEPNKVICDLRLPTGSIGDYVWFDDNQDGIQNDTKDLDGNDYDFGLNGITANLWQNITYRANGEIMTRKVKIKTDITKSKDGKKGYYEFPDLPCNYLESGKTDKTDPDNYIGNEYYSYYVEFVLPDGTRYTPAVKYAGQDEKAENDSNINPDGTTDLVELWVTKDAGTNRLYGEHRTDIDAGFVNSYAIGDYVWKDSNCNGLQDETEPGVEDVSVRLYKVDGADVSVKDGDKPIASTLTDENGFYSFENLMQGYYVVEFDTTTLTRRVNESGYVYQYDFTKVLKEQNGVADDYKNENNKDSDAQYDVTADGRIRRTRIIRLTKNELGMDKYMDERWDAGLVEYSAIGGFCFDDADYNNLHLDTLNIPLAGTKVQLYKVNNGIRENNPIAETTVGEDGRYYFDHLLVPNGEYQDYAVRFEYPKGYSGVDSNQDTDKGAFETNDDSDSKIDSDVNEFLDIDRTAGYIKQIRLYPETISTTWDAGARKYSAIGDYVWIDANKNGLQDKVEKPLDQVRVVLQSRKNAESGWEYVRDTFTDENGWYEFRKLESSQWINTEYRVVFALGRTRKVTTANVIEGNRASTNDSDALGVYQDGIIPGTILYPESTGGYVTTNIKPDYGEEDMTWDAGVIPTISALGDYVWYDDDHNGIQDSGEKGVPNTKAALECNESGRTGISSEWKEIKSTYTDENGYYWFPDLNPGYYRVRFYIPDGYTATRYNRGEGANGNAVDSDASRPADDNSYYSRNFYLDEDTQDPTWDAGIYKPARTVRRTTTRRTVTRRRSARGARGARTGDMASIALWALMLSASAGGGVILIYRKKRKKSGER